MTATNTIEFLLSDAAKAGRLTRQVGYAALYEASATMVVHVETLHTGMQEFDAEDETHAEHIIANWIVNLGAKSARFHHVNEDGSLHSPSSISSFIDFQDCFAA